VIRGIFGLEFADYLNGGWEIHKLIVIKENGGFFN
jgi:hypothetical protein